MYGNQIAVDPQVFGLAEAARAPVRRCVVNRDWDRRRFAVLGIIRGEPGGPAAISTVHVDLGCLGLRHASLRFGSPELLAELLAESGLPAGRWNDCPPGLVAALIDAGADLGWVNGAGQSPRFRLVQRLFDTIEPDEALPPIETGHPTDGQPLYVPRPGDDGPAIVAHLGRVFGPTGFTVGGEPPLPTGDGYPFEREAGAIDGAVLRAGVLGRRLVAWRTGSVAVSEALGAAVDQARRAGLSDAVAFAAAPWHARCAGRAVVDVFAAEAPGLTALDRAIARGWSESAGLRLVRLDAVDDDGFSAWDPLAGTLRRMVTDDRRIRRKARALEPGSMAWVVARPMGDDPRGEPGRVRWFADRLVPLNGGAAAAERALIAFESAVASMEGPESVEDTLDRALDAPPRETGETSLERLLLRLMDRSTAPPEESPIF